MTEQKAKPQKPKRKESVPVKIEAPRKKSTGIRTAVRYGEISPELALHRLEEARTKGEFVSDEIIHWLKHRKKVKNKPTNQPVEEEECDDENYEDED